jgi:hypothetical protein
LRADRPLLAAAVVVLGIAAIAGTWRVAVLESLELEQEPPAVSLAEALALPESTPETARLGEVELRRGEEAVFELCSDDALAPDRWDGAIEIGVWNPGAEELLHRTPLDRDVLEDARRGRAGACITVARGVVRADGAYAIEAVLAQPLPNELERVPLRVRVLARAPLGPIDRVPVVVAILGGFLLVLALIAGARPAEAQHAARAVDVVVRLAIGVLVVLGVAIAVAAMPFDGAAPALVGGLAFALAEVIVALALVPRPARERLGLTRPARSWAAIAGVTLVVALLLVAAARLAIAWVPSTGEAPIQAFVSWPSGVLSFALLAVLVPLAEEIFFRGFVYGAVLRFGHAAAFIASVALFVAAHAPQVWGAWGGLVAVSCTALGLTALRTYSGSILPGAAVHLAYNTLLAASAVF